ncbi:hypothetical protein SAMN02745244_03122 [Tessaracoccus bendigoensis DSM 12906]|uniref:Uncharacterized protein n=1 Tax=Tessaracoccus bendigoensis DSM 12906 TaxID=1123357 RepID=A0A1M6LN11_9ACTN|nr:hypothetical protein SAMN02745244_03122 [Tessaracoccus bendigoensis DSM 12906]
MGTTSAFADTFRGVSGLADLVGDQFDHLADIAGQSESGRTLYPLGVDPVQQVVAVPIAINPDQLLFPGREAFR